MFKRPFNKHSVLSLHTALDAFHCGHLQETCPYDNEKLLRKKRSVNETESVLLGRLKRQSYDGLSYSEYRSRNYRGYGGRYDDYRGRYDDYSRGYGRRYGDREDGGRGRYDDRFNYGRDSGRVRTYPCGRWILC